MVSKSPAIARSLGGVRACAEPLAGSTMVVACSGGADSATMLALLNMVARGLELSLVVTHVDHGLRDGSASEGELVRSQAEELGLPFTPGGRLRLDRGPGLPARAREARRAALRAVAEGIGGATAPWIALGHTATDQVETVLMHLTRGAGLDGLSGMPERDTPWVRPILHLSRARARQIAGELGLRFVDDPTNHERDQFRVELRLEVLPRLRAHNPRLEEAIRGTTRLVSDADEALVHWVDVEYRKRRAEDPTGVHWCLVGFSSLPRAVRLGLLRRAAIEMGADMAELRRSVLEQVDAAATGPQQAARSWDVHPERRLVVERRRFWVVSNH